MTAKKDITAVAFVGFIIFLTVVTFILKLVSDRMRLEYEEKLWHRPDGKAVSCVIQVREQDDTTAALLSGYNYRLMELFSEHTGIDFEISLAKRGEDCTDSLRSGAIDILVLPYGTESVPDGCICSSHLDSTSVWLMNESNKRRLADADKWIEFYHASGWSEEIRSRYFDVYSPFNSPGKKRKHLSPYDDLIRQYADSIDWDWRLLAAVIYSESRFRIEVVSYRGATGLMQLMPNGTADGDMVNPENNIRAGSLRLGQLTKRYRNIAPDIIERRKLALASYNAGAGRMKDVLNYAAVKGVDRSCWDSLAAMIPQMRDSSNLAGLDTVKLGIFKGVETIDYVGKVMRTYETFKTLIPE